MGIDEGVRHLRKSQEREILEEISIYFQLAGITQSSDAGPGLKNAEGSVAASWHSVSIKCNKTPL